MTNKRKGPSDYVSGLVVGIWVGAMFMVIIEAVLP